MAARHTTARPEQALGTGCHDAGPGLHASRRDGRPNSPRRATAGERLRTRLDGHARASALARAELRGCADERGLERGARDAAGRCAGEEGLESGHPAPLRRDALASGKGTRAEGRRRRNEGEGGVGSLLRTMAAGHGWLCV
jgi:hypothetical protein